MKHKLEYILEDIEKYKDYDFEKDVHERLNKTLQRYLDELENSYLRLKVKNAVYITKRLSR